MDPRTSCLEVIFLQSMSLRNILHLIVQQCTELQMQYFLPSTGKENVHINLANNRRGMIPFMALNITKVRVALLYYIQAAYILINVINGEDSVLSELSVCN